MTNLYVLIMVLGGACIAAQISMNAQFGAVAGSPLWAANVSFLVSMLAGLVGLTLAAAAGGLPSLPSAVWNAPLWVWLGGLGGAIYVFLAAILAHRLGAALLSAAGILGQLGAALLIDHFGWFAMPVSRISASRVAGVVLLMLGVLLLRR